MSLDDKAEVFEYALLRVVPRVERGEAINAGVIVYAQAFRYLCARTQLDESRLLALDPAADLDAVRAGLAAFEKACTEGPLAVPPARRAFPLAHRRRPDPYLGRSSSRAGPVPAHRL